LQSQRKKCADAGHPCANYEGQLKTNLTVATKQQSNEEVVRIGRNAVAGQYFRDLPAELRVLSHTTVQDHHHRRLVGSHAGHIHYPPEL